MHLLQRIKNKTSSRLPTIPLVLIYHSLTPSHEYKYEPCHSSNNFQHHTQQANIMMVTSTTDSDPVDFNNSFSSICSNDCSVSSGVHFGNVQVYLEYTARRSSLSSVVLTVQDFEDQRQRITPGNGTNAATLKATTSMPRSVKLDPPTPFSICSSGRTRRQRRRKTRAHCTAWQELPETDLRNFLWAHHNANLTSK